MIVRILLRSIGEEQPLITSKAKFSGTSPSAPISSSFLLYSWE
uniref:Uncharacterized protein n=1 Tax=Rhizophora mucronata TaxID=61149 RepID=A0A2P2P9Q8_RHIMU